MTVIHLPGGPLDQVPLGIETRTVLGAHPIDGADIEDRISLGRPACLALDPDTVDPDARMFLQGKPGSKFWLLALTCSFRAVQDEPIEKAWLEIALETTAPDGATDPIAWSMEPLALTSPVQVSSTAKLDASLKLTSQVVPIEGGPSASRETARSYTQLVPYLEAHREGTSRPSWIFTHTPVTEVRGVHHLRTVVELPAGAQGRAQISAGATLKRKLLGLVSYRARLDRLPAHELIALGDRASADY